MTLENSELQRLIRLQELDLKIVELKEKSQQIPHQLELLDQSLETTRRHFEDSHQRTEEEHRQRRLLEGEVEMLRQKLSRYKDQLMEVKTNREYQAMLHEIANVEGEIRRQEDQILEGMLAADEWEQNVREARRRVEETEKQVAAQRQELAAFARQSEEEITRLQGERPRLLEQIPSLLVGQYEKIAAARRGVALAEARDQSCQACHVKLRPQLFNDLKLNRSIITCESCNRILYYPGS